jgi:hypothetical protein
MRGAFWMAVMVSTLAGLAAPAGAQDKKQVTAGPEYAASETVRKWFGDGYRDVWTTPFDAPALDLAKEAGGLEPVRQVGGLQTAGLALRGADGRSYTFRSLHKEPERLLPAEWQDSWPAKLLRDATSATHPGAAVMLPVLAEAAGIPHTQPRLVVMPDDPKLGEFRKTFANQLGTFEEYPTAASGSHAGFDGATAIISTAELWSRWLQGPENRVDSRALLRARILDLFVENYDRRRGQWRWMQIPGKTGWQALPEDPDMAFVRHNGLVIAAMRSRQPRLLEFSERYPSNLEGPTSIAEVDRWLLADLEAPAYEQIARELQAAWTDDVIDRTVAALPEEWRALDKGFLTTALKARRAALVPYVQRFYRYLAERVDLHLTDQDERIVIATAGDRSTTVTVTAGSAPAPYYSRTFHPGETSEVRIYVHGGIDRVERTGNGGAVHVRVIAGEGAKTVVSAGTRTEVWAGKGQVGGQKTSRHDPWTNPTPVKDGPWLEPRNYGTSTLWQPMAWYGPDIGVVVGASVTHTTYGFRTMPAAKVQTVTGGWAFGDMSGKIEYDGVFRRPASTMAFDFNAFASGIEHINFFGAGNETPKVSRSAYRSPQRLFSVAPSARFGSSKLSLVVGPELRYSKSGNEPGTVLFEQSPYGTGDFGLVAFRASIEADTRSTNTAGVLAVATGAAPGESGDQPPGRGVRVVGSTFVAPAVWDVDEKYGGVDGSFTAYAGTTNVQIGARVGGARMFGNYPWFDAAYIGGRTDRGYRSHRFSGDGSLYGNLELRTYLGHPMFQSVFPVRFGLVGFVDGGRVWLSGEDSRRWHPSAGGGALLKPVGTTIVLRAIVAHGSEGTLFYAGNAIRF